MSKSYRQKLIDAIKHADGYHGKGYSENVPGYVFSGHFSTVSNKLTEWEHEQLKKRAILKLETNQGAAIVYARQFVEALQIASDAVGLKVDRDGLHVRDGSIVWNFKPLNDLKADFTVRIPLGE